MIRYINMKGAEGIETIDEFNSMYFPSRSLFIKEVRRMVQEYRLAGMAAYSSSRSTKDWRER